MQPTLSEFSTFGAMWNFTTRKQPLVKLFINLAVWKLDTVLIPSSSECVLCFSPERPREGAASYPHRDCKTHGTASYYIVLPFNCLYSPILHSLVMSWIVLGEELHHLVVPTSPLPPLPMITGHNTCTWNSTYLSSHNCYLNNMSFKSNFPHESHGCSSKVCWSRLQQKL